MASANGNNRAEYEQATSGLPFTKDFNDAIEAVMHDELETASTRILAWLKRTSWGRFSLFCRDDDGAELFQQDCARELGLDKRLVSKTMQYLESRGYLDRRGTAKVLYPVLSPVLSGPDPSIVNKSPAWATFLETWKVAHAGDFSEYEVARATVERIRKVLHADYRKSQKQATNAPASLSEISEDPEEEEERVSQSVNEETDGPTDELEAIAQAIPAYLCEELGETPSRTLLEDTRQALNGAPPGRLTVIINRKRSKITSLGIIPHFAAEIGRTWEAGERARTAAIERDRGKELQYAEDGLATAHRILNDPNAPDDEKELARDIMRQANGRAHAGAT